MKKTKKKKNRKKTPIWVIAFNVISVLFIVGSACFYGYRLYYLTKENNKTSTEDGYYYLSDSLLKKESKLDLTQGFVLGEDGNYYYKGQIEDNYVNYSGRTYRIIGMDANGSVKVISENVETVLFTPQRTDYATSSMRYWLSEIDGIDNSGIYFGTLNTPKEYLTTVTEFTDVVDDVSDIANKEVFDTDYVSLLSLYDYKMAGGANSFLNNGENFMLITVDSKGDPWFVSSDGGINVMTNGATTLGIRPVISLVGETKVLSGTGTKSDPYILEPERTVSTIMQANVSEKVSYSGYTWTVTKKADNMVFLTLSEPLKVDGEVYKTIYGKSTEASFKDSKSVFNYLNNTFLSSLENTDILCDIKWYTGSFTDMFSYDYFDVYKKSVTAKVGLIKYSDMYLDAAKDVFTTTGASTSNKTIYIISDDLALFSDSVSNEHGITPCIAVLGTTPVVSGSGAGEDPFVIK